MSRPSARPKRAPWGGRFQRTTVMRRCSLTLSGQQQRGRPHELRCSPAAVVAVVLLFAEEEFTKHESTRFPSAPCSRPGARDCVRNKYERGEEKRKKFTRGLYPCRLVRRTDLVWSSGVRSCVVKMARFSRPVGGFFWLWGLLSVKRSPRTGRSDTVLWFSPPPSSRPATAEFSQSRRCLVACRRLPSYREDGRLSIEGDEHRRTPG